MRATRARRRSFFLAGLVGLVAAGCAGSTAPSRWLPDAGEAQREAYGGWVTVSYATAGPRFDRYDGELIAISMDSLYVLADDTLHAVSLSSVHNARVMSFDSYASIIAAWTVLGVMSTPSHGFIAGISAPVWLLCGGIATASASREPRAEYEAPEPDEGYPAKGSLDALRPFARFPRGLPTGLDRSLLKSKVVVRHVPRAAKR